MKNFIKQIFLFGLMGLFMISCSSQRPTAGVTERITKGDVSGTWTVTDVSLEGFPEGYQVGNVFGMAPYRDFVGSTWTLYGGYGGQIALTNGTKQEIYWSLDNQTFMFKKLGAGQKASEVKEGYELRASDATKTSLTLRSPFTLANGNTANVVYSLSKTR